ncbi:MAG: amidohydrolase family protein [Clostridia bacterium]|nr:amidohydrolase family protein [Clostridia bacterium]
MRIRIQSDRILSPQGIFSGYIYCTDGMITEVTLNGSLPYDKAYDRTGLYVSAGFIDMHTHGANGFDFSATADDIVNGCNFLLRHGATSVCPTVSAAPFFKMAAAVHSIRSAMKSPRLQTHIPGAHLEGPYLSPAQCGAQNAAILTDPVPEEYTALVRECGGAIIRWTYAPERDPRGTFCSFLRQNGIVPSAGHTDATYSQMLPALENGCNLITHLYSCTSTVTRDHGFRRPGVIETAFLRDDLYVEIIADGKHLPPELIRLVLKIKGADHVALVTDSLAPAGTDVTHGMMAQTPFVVENGVCMLSDRSAFAGSIALPDMLVRVLTREAGVSVSETVKMLTAVPAKILGLNRGVLAEGYEADIIAFDDEINIQSAFVSGKEMF